MISRKVYLDFQASTPLDESILEIMTPYFSENYGNPHSNDHFFGWEANEIIEKYRSKIAQAINCDKSEVVFTSGATEANNLAMKGLKDYLKKINKTTILVSSIEHKCIIESALSLENEGFSIKFIETDEFGSIKIDHLESSINSTVGLISIMLVNNEIGSIQPIKKIASIAQKHNVYLHTDAAQAPIFSDIDVQDFGVQMMSLSGHKIYGPKGIGLLYISNSIRKNVRPLIHGGGQENGLRSGTLPTALCIGLGEALDLSQSKINENADKLQLLKNHFWKNLSSKIDGIAVNGNLKNGHPGNLNIFFPNVSAQTLLQALQPCVAASTGSACNSGIEEHSYVLKQIGKSDEMAKNSIRFSFGINQSIEQIDVALSAIIQAYHEQLSYT